MIARRHSECSERSACRHFGLHRSTFQYKAKQPDAWLAKLKTAIRRLSRKHPQMGYPKITRLLKAEGWNVGAGKVQRLRHPHPVRGPCCGSLPAHCGNAISTSQS